MKQYLIENRHKIVEMKNVQYRGVWIRFKKNIDPDSDPNPVSPERLHSVRSISDRPDPKQCKIIRNMYVYV